MALHTELKNKIRKEAGLNYTSERLNINDWVRWLKGNTDLRLSNLGTALAWGCKTGRITHYTNEHYLLNPHTNKLYSNLQMTTVFAKAALTLNSSGGSLQDGLNSLQNAMNKTIKIL